ncbi:MAG TPA: Na+/H+ antiporter subunit E [Rubrivivax sp.]|nr:Na+/H+ antiporter subunit E [Rubrivivax sp.]
MRRRLLPHPYRSLAIVVLWLSLNNTIDPGQVVLGLLIGWLLPLLVGHFWPTTVVLQRPWRAVAFAGVVIKDVILANLRVARAILGSPARLRPGFIRVPLDLQSDVGITVLAQTITLTPGTVSADITPDRRTLIVHYLDEGDPEALIAEIKRRYERPIMEMFG